MTLSTNLKAINCSSCGAGLDVLGGGRVQVHICPYCSTALDTLDNYRALSKFASLDRPDSPFAIGMTGTLFGVEFRVIGTLCVEETHQHRRWTWVEHQIYSPTHGYAWLTVDRGHVTFSRRHRGSEWLSSYTIEIAENRPSLRTLNQTFRYYETSSSRIIFAEGEFTWMPKAQTYSTSVSVMSDTEMLEFSDSETERETYRSVYIPPETIKDGFGVDLPKTTRVSPLQPFRQGPNHRFFMIAGAIFAAASILLGVFSADTGEVPVRGRTVPVADFPVDIPFEVTRPNRTTKVELRSNGFNSWTWVEAEVSDPEDRPLFEVGRILERYSGRDSDGPWTEDRNTNSFRFVAKQTGTYTLSLDLSENEIWTEGTGTQQTPSTIKVTVRTGLLSGMWLYLLGLGFAVIAGFPKLRQVIHQRQRWSGSDWTED